MSAPKITPFLMFSGNAEEAVRYYLSVFEGSEIIAMRRYGPNEPGTEGTVMRATFSLAGQTFMCIDSAVQHNFTFTPAISFFVTYDRAEEVEATFHKLAENGTVLMPLEAYPFSARFGWVQDRFGVSWQISLPVKD